MHATNRCNAHIQWLVEGMAYRQQEKGKINVCIRYLKKKKVAEKGPAKGRTWPPTMNFNFHQRESFHDRWKCEVGLIQPAPFLQALQG
jgi:hypothetical protein